MNVGDVASVRNPYRFDGTRYARHWDGYNQWCQQKLGSTTKAKRIMTQYVHDCASSASRDPFPALPSDCFRYITVYVKVNDSEAEKYWLDLLQSMGGSAKFVVVVPTIIPSLLLVQGKLKGGNV